MRRMLRDERAKTDLSWMYRYLGVGFTMMSQLDVFGETFIC